MVWSILRGDPGPRRDIVLVNAGAALVTAGLASTYRESMPLAREAIDSGRALAVLDAFIAFTRS